MSNEAAGCRGYGSAAMRKHGRERHGRQSHRCLGCGRRSTARSTTPFAGCRSPPDIIALAVRRYLRYRLGDADVAELLAERGVVVDPSSLYAWGQEFAPLYAVAARQFRASVGGTRSVDETYATMAGKPVYGHRAIDGRGRVVDVYVGARRAAAGAATCFRRAIESTGVVPDEVTTAGAAASPPALAAVLPGVLHETGEAVQQRIERDHRHPTGRRAPTRGFKTLAGARMLCRAHALPRNLRGGSRDLGRPVAAVAVPPPPPPMQAWAVLTGTPLGR